MDDEHVTCIRHTRADMQKSTWCGKRVSGFVFQSLDHAAYNDGRLVACPQCVGAAVSCLRGMTVEDIYGEEDLA